ncbi:MAG: ABC transporter ATP-binding protein [Lentisphaeria bacterium]|nr:ABC transporter ATP-binding protein [Lentisphaeria bacterium]
MPEQDTTPREPVLRVEDLRTAFYTRRGAARAVDGVSFEVHAGETLCLVGESGCGKSVTAMSILRLISPPGRIDGGTVRFAGRNLLDLPERELRRIRGARISMIFQEPMTSLNPVFTIGSQIIEAIELHRGLRDEQARALAVDTLRTVGIADPERRVDEYPHQLSGGMKQRAMIAMALVCRPALLLADEPTTALDVTIQAQILDLMRDLQQRFGMALILITHDLGVVAEVADRVAVMYAGRIVESAAAIPLFEDPKHPYTRALLRSLPGARSARERLEAIPGQVPSALRYPPGCRFCDRCDLAVERCRAEYPPLVEKSPGHWSACWVLP